MFQFSKKAEANTEVQDLTEEQLLEIAGGKSKGGTHKDTGHHSSHTHHKHGQKSHQHRGSHSTHHK